MAKEQKKFLDQSGVGTLWGKILVELNKKIIGAIPDVEES